MKHMPWSKTLEYITGRRRLVFCVTLALPAVLAGAVAVRGRDKEPEADKHVPRSVAEPPSVRLIKPQLRKIVRIVGQPSFVEPYERSSVYPKMTAYIDQWNVDIGDTVKKGEVLAKLYVPELVEDWGTKKATVKVDEQRVELARKIVKVAEADVKAAEAHLAEARAILDQYEAQVVRWESEVKRLKREVRGGVVDPQVLLESENQWRSSRAAREAAKATILKAEAELLSKQAIKIQDDIAVEVARADLKVAESEAKRLEALVGYLVLPAPFNGVITVRNANTFDFVLPATGDPTAMQHSPHLSPGGAAAPIYVVDRTDIVRIFVDIPEHDANYVRKGTKASVHIRGFRDQWIPATVTRTSWALNVKSRTLRAEIDLPNTDSQILPGMYAYGKVIIERPGVWSLPLSALSTIGDKTSYWSHQRGSDGKDRAVRNELRTGVSDGTWIEVTNRQLPEPVNGADSWALIDGSERVLDADDLGMLTHGDPVRFSSATDAAKNAAATKAHAAP